ncbi:MAG: hypothetical protein IJL12_04065 [Selenomonadaceae bacterium]|nr:hypothetical protein [Selenomonadaceae bacterium]
MIRKSLAAVALAFMIILVGSQSNLAEARNIYIGTFGNNCAALKGKDCYLIDDSVTRDSYYVNNSTIIQCATGVTDFGQLNFTFKRVSTKDWVFIWSFAGLGGGGSFGVINVDWNDVDGKLLRYILNNYD